MAHEKMEVYAFVGIYESIGKLLIVYLLTRASDDKLIVYAILVASVGFSVTAFYIYYTKRKFEEVRFQIRFNKSTFVSILKFSGWNIIANFSNTLVLQGVIMLFNLFFMPVVVASQAIATQISRAMMQFVDSVRFAVNPQIIKLYADQNYEESKKLTLESAGYIFDLLLLLGLPCILIMPALLDVWLVNVPEYAVIFAQFVVFQNIIENFNAAFYTPMVAAGKVKKNSLSAIFLCVFQFIILYFLFKLGFDAILARYISLMVSFIYAFVVKPYILHKDINYTYKELYSCIWESIKVLLVAGVLTICIYIFIPQTSLLVSVLVSMLDFAVILFASFIFLKKSVRKWLIDLLLRKLNLRYS
jgi:O-antigen/teichoic acid export membrane protein